MTALKRKLLMDVNKLSSSEMTQIQEIFSSEKPIFDGLESVRKQEVYFQEHFNYVVRDVTLLENMLTVLLECICVT